MTLLALPLSKPMSQSFMPLSFSSSLVLDQPLLTVSAHFFFFEKNYPTNIPTEQQFHTSHKTVSLTVKAKQKTSFIMLLDI